MVQTDYANPFLSKDIDAIINAFVDPVIQTARTVTNTTKDVIVGAPSWLKNVGGDNSVAALSNKLQEKLDQARGAVEALYSYGTAYKQPKSFDIPGLPGVIPGVTGIEINNTALTMLDAENVGDALKTLVADCIPCKDRVIALLGINPIEDLWGHLTAMYTQCTGFLLALYDLLLGDKSIDVFNDFCSLFKFLSFMCVPDLAAMIMTLSRLMTKYSIEMSDVQIGFMNIMSRLSGPALAPLMATVDKYIQLIIAPLECVVAALDAQLQKIDVVQAWEKNIGQNKNAERSFDLKSIGGPLQALKKYLTDSIAEAKKEFEKLDKSMKDLLGLQSELDKHMFDLSHHIEMCARFIGIIQAIIVALSQGTISCGPTSNGSEDLKNFLNNYFAPIMDVSIVMQDDQALIQPRVPKEVGELLQTLAVYKQERPDVTAVSPKTVSALPVAQATVVFKNCLYTVQDAELNKVKDFLGDL